MQHGATVFTTGTNKRAEKEVEEIPGRRFMHCHEACMEAQKLDNPMLGQEYKVTYKFSQENISKPWRVVQNYNSSY